MSKIMQAWEQLLFEAIDKDVDTREYAIFQMGLILERHYQPNLDAPDLYEENLSRELQRLTLSNDRQKDAIVYLLRVVTDKPASASSAMYAISRTDPNLSMPLIVDFVKENHKKMFSTVAQQIVATCRYALATKDDALVANVKSLKPFIKQWANDKSDEELSNRASALLKKL